jgi:hypothetical protein
VAGCFENCNEHWSCTNGGKFLDLLSDYQLLKKNSVLLVN